MIKPLFRRLLSRLIRRLLVRQRSAENLLRLLNDVDLRIRISRSSVHTLAKELKTRIEFADIGARGDLHPFAREFASVVNLKLFEPDAGEAASLSDRLIVFPNVTVAPVAIGAHFTRQTLYVTRKPGGSSLLHPQGPMQKLIQRNHPDLSRFDVVETVEVSVVPLHSAVSKLDLLKIDTQGTALEVLEGLGSLRPLLIEVEVEMAEIYSGQSTLFEVGGLLRRLGYFLVENRIHREPLGIADNRGYRQVVQISGDVLFAPDLTAMGQSITRGREEEFRFLSSAYAIGDYADWYLQNVEKPRVV